MKIYLGHFFEALLNVFNTVGVNVEMDLFRFAWNF